MNIRRLEVRDYIYMYEWMQDAKVTEFMKTNFSCMTSEDCIKFIENSSDIDKNLHLAIVNDNDEYMGTVSLKNIDNRSAEFAITIRSCAMGKGYSAFGMKKVIEIALMEMKLDYVYWYVDKSNVRAIKFYDKMGYRKLTYDEIHHILCNEYVCNDYVWYLVGKDEGIYEDGIQC